MSRRCILGWAGFLLLLAFVSPARGQTPPDSMTDAAKGSPPPPAAWSAADSIQVTLHDGRTFTAARVESRFQDYVHVVHFDGSEEYIAANKVAWIRGANGKDWTTKVLTHREGVGKLPPDEGIRRGGGPHIGEHPLARCRWFALSQAGVAARLDAGPGIYEKKSPYVLLDYGAMKNVADRVALGGNLYVGGDDYRARFGAKARLRYWATSYLALDLAPGILVAGSDQWGGTAGFPGFVAEAGISVTGVVHLTGQMESVSIRDRYGRHVQDTAWYGGVKLGGEPGVIATAVGLAAFIFTRGMY